MATVINLTIQHKATNDAWDIATLTKSIKWETHLRGQPGKLTVDLLAAFNAEDITVSAGDIVYLEVNNVRLFWGFLFTITQNRYGEKTFTFYDQVRYLSKTRTSDIFTGISTDDIVRRVAGKFNLNVGNLAKGGYLHANWIKEDANIIDIIDDSCAMTYQNTGNVLVFYDKSGFLTLDIPQNVFPDYQKYCIGDGSLAQDYTYKQDIDANTFNSIVMQRPNPTDGKTDSVGTKSYTFLSPQQDSTTVNQWGVLQKVIQMQQGVTTQQMALSANAYLHAYNHPLETLQFKTFGVVGVRAGCLLPIYLPEISDTLNFLPLLMDTVTHEFTDNDHQMSLDMRVML
jgi:hypothetical protein